MVTETLPKPDEKGNYWLGLPCKAPAIIISPRIPETPSKLRESPKWFVSLPAEHADSCLFNGPNLVYFDSPQLALEALRKEVG